MAISTIQTRLCPNCANSIALDTLTCPYCRASLSAAPAPQWPSQDNETPAVTVTPRNSAMPLGSKVILVLGVLVFALGVFLVGGHSERSDLAPLLEAKEKALQANEQKLKTLEAQLAQTREELTVSTARLEELRNKLNVQEKSLAAAQQKRKDAEREVNRLASRPAPALPPVRSRAQSPALPPPPPTPTARRILEPGLYETVRATDVHEEPLSSSRVLNRIGGGTEITVVRGLGQWLEVRSKHGNPPGFVRTEDAKFVARAN
ncbi:MAG: hypothetical protein ACXWYD_08470 [Candidatus Binatia bacterium]